MFPIRKDIVLLQLNGKEIRTTADHPLFVQGKGWTEVADLHPGDRLLSYDGQPVLVERISDSGEQAVVYNLPLGEHLIPDPTSLNEPNKPILGFAAGTPLLTPEGYKPIEELKPGDFLLSQPDDQDIGKPDADEEDPDSTGKRDSEN